MHLADGDEYQRGNSHQHAKLDEHARNAPPLERDVAPHLLRQAKKLTVSIMSTVITRPGRMPARKSWPIDTLAIIP